LRSGGDSLIGDLEADTIEDACVSGSRRSRLEHLGREVNAHDDAGITAFRDRDRQSSGSGSNVEHHARSQRDDLIGDLGVERLEQRDRKARVEARPTRREELQALIGPAHYVGNPLGADTPQHDERDGDPD